MGDGVALATALSIPLHHIGLIQLVDWHGTDRNHPQSVRRRFFAITVSNVIAVISVWAVLGLESWGALAAVLGVRGSDAGAVIFGVVLHTALFFLPNIVDAIVDWDWLYVKGTVQDITWIRNTFMAPIGEELAFRACAGQLVASALGRSWSTWLSPWLFGVCHLHLIADDRRRGYTWTEALRMRGFQVLYTYVFGVYAAVLFFRTGNILAPIICHSICNNLGLPIIVELPARPACVYRSFLVVLSIVSLIAFVMTFHVLIPSHNFY